MRCRRTDCFGFTMIEENNCKVLQKRLDPCPFYKTKRDLEEERERLVAMGKPWYEPSRTRAEEMRLARLLKGDEIHKCE